MNNIEMAIVGIGLCIGEFDSVESYMKGLMTSKKAFQPGDESISAYSADRGTQIEKTVAEALRDSGHSASGGNETAVVLHCAASPSEKLFEAGGEATKVAARFQLGGPAFTAYDGENSIFRGLSLAERLLAEGLATSVVVCVAPPPDGAVSEKERASAPRRSSKQNGETGFEKAEGGEKAEGAAVLVLKAKERALEERDKIYACISSVLVAETQSVSDGISKTLEAGGIGHGELRVLEFPGQRSGEYEKEIENLCRENYKDYLDGAGFTLTGTESWMGRELAITAAAAFVKHALQLFFFHVYVFEPAPVLGPRLFIEHDPSQWDLCGEKRAALIAGVPENRETGGYAGFAVLTECVSIMADDRKCRSDTVVLPIACNDPEDLRNKLLAYRALAANAAKTANETGAQLRALWEKARLEYQNAGEPKYTAALLFESAESLDEEIAALLEGFGELTEGGGFKAGAHYESARGSYFTTSPYGKETNVIYMNPPGTMQHMLLFHEMLLLFPSYRYDYTTYQNGGFFKEMEGLDYRFGRFCMEMHMIWIAAKIALQKFGLSPDVLIGASLGEIASLFSYDSIVYDIKFEGDEAILNMLKAFWEVYNYSPEPMLVMYIKDSLEKIRQAVDAATDVYLSFEASPNDAFIAGKPEAVAHLIKENGFLAFPVFKNLTIHTPLVSHFYGQIYDVVLSCNNRLKSDLGFEIYSTYTKKPIDTTPESLAEYSAAILTTPCDFYGLLEHLYKGGGRVFVDMSTGSSCLAWAKETFADRDVMSFSIYPSFIDSRGSLTRIFAKLLANQMDFNYDAFFDSFTYPILEGDEYAKAAEKRPSPPVAAIESSPQDPVQNGTIVIPAAPSPDTCDLTPDPIGLPESGGADASKQPQAASGGTDAGRSGADEYISRGLYLGMRAYELYLENESFLLDALKNAARKEPAAKRGRALWELDEILEITCGAPSKVLGEQYAFLDPLRKRSRLPMPPFLFVSRITAINAEYGKMQPSYLDMEYDITEDSIMRLSKSTISYVILTEASHVAILLFSYMGIDAEYGKEISYRMLNTQEALHGDFPVLGDTIKARLEFLELSKSGTATLVKLRFTCYNKNELLLTMELLGGFFLEEDLADNKGVIAAKRPKTMPLAPRKSIVRPRAEQITDMLSFYNGEYGPWLTPSRTSGMVERMYVNPKIRMVDRILKMDFEGGDYGLGIVIGEKDIDSDHWAFGVHFLNDPVFPGSLIAEAANHLQLLFAMNAGFVDDGKYYLGCKQGLEMRSIFRGQIRPIASTVRYENHIKEIAEEDGKTVIVADCDAFWQGRHVVRTENMSLVIERNTYE